MAHTELSIVELNSEYQCHLDGCESASGHLLHGHGNPDMKRFWSKIDRLGPEPEQGTLAYGSGPCWVWLDAPMTNIQYGRFRVGGRQPYAHIFMHEHAHGTIPQGYHIDHRCNIRNCVCPIHLEAVTPSENAQRSWDFRHYRKALGLGPRMNYIPVKGGKIDWAFNPVQVASTAN